MRFYAQWERYLTVFCDVTVFSRSPGVRNTSGPSSAVVRLPREELSLDGSLSRMRSNLQQIMELMQQGMQEAALGGLDDRALLVWRTDWHERG